MLQIQGLTVKLGNFVLREITLALPEGCCGVIVGPSGAGKSTLLEAIAGLCEVTGGRIFLDGHDITDFPPEKRGIAFVPQDYALFPHLSARGNIWLAPRLLKLPRAEMEERFAFLCELLNLHALLDRRPHQLSGGERQRVALARALMLRPRLLVLDEPFAALDPQMRPSVRRTLRRIFRTLKVTVLVVTHDPLDAAALGDFVFVLEDGRIIQRGTWREIMTDPKSSFVAEFIGINLFTGVIRWDGNQAYLVTKTARLPVQTDLPDGTPARLCFFPSQVHFVSEGKGTWQGTIVEVIGVGDRTQIVVEVGDEIFVRAEAPMPCPYGVGAQVSFTIPVTPKAEGGSALKSYEANNGTQETPRP